MLLFLQTEPLNSALGILACNFQICLASYSGSLYFQTPSTLINLRLNFILEKEFGTRGVQLVEIR